MDKAKQRQKPHDLRDDIYPATSITNTDERLAGAEPGPVDPEQGGPRLVTPAADKPMPPGSTTRG